MQGGNHFEGRIKAFVSCLMRASFLNCLQSGLSVACLLIIAIVSNNTEVGVPFAHDVHMAFKHKIKETSKLKSITAPYMQYVLCASRRFTKP